MSVVGVDVSADWVAFAVADDRGAFAGGYRHDRPRNLSPERWRLKIARRTARLAAATDTTIVAWSGCRDGCSHDLAADLDGLDVVRFAAGPAPRPLPAGADARLGTAFALAAAAAGVPA